MIWIHVQCITLFLNFYRYTFSIWLCNAYQFRLHKWIMYNVYTNEKPVWRQRWQLLYFFCYSLDAKRIKKSNEKEKAYFRNNLFLYNYLNYVTWFTLDNNALINAFFVRFKCRDKIKEYKLPTKLHYVNLLLMMCNDVVLFKMRNDFYS